jgi:DNA-binding NtrC family response regulator
VRTPDSGTRGTASLDDDRPDRDEARAPCLFVALSADAPASTPLRLELRPRRRVIVGRGEGGVTSVDGSGDDLRLRLADSRASRDHAEIVPALGGHRVRDLGSKNGTRLNDRPVGPDQPVVLADGDVLQIGHTFLVHRASAPRVAGDGPIALAGVGLETMSPTLGRTFERLAGVASTPIAVLVKGETGTGKELAARAVHALSGRRGPFVAVNCGAIPPDLFEAEMFGHRRGAFSGAIEDRPGLIRAASGGTLFLDEIGDLPPRAQAVFLRALQEREVLPIGETKAVPVDFRLVAATHWDLHERAAAGSFRSDLLARLTGFVIELPALRDRREDLGLIVGAILGRHAPDRAASFTLRRQAAHDLVLHPWPRNVRELEQAILRALASTPGGAAPIRSEDLGLEAETRLRDPSARASESPPAPGSKQRRPLRKADLVRRDRLVALLAEHDGNLAAVARAMGKARTQVQRWIRRYAIEI